MNELKGAVKALALAELDRADKLHGDFRNKHEAYGMIVEELDEVIAHFGHVQQQVNVLRCDLYKIKQDPLDYEALYRNAVAAACELVQVAAMGLKGKRMAENAKGLG